MPASIDGPQPELELRRQVFARCAAASTSRGVPRAQLLAQARRRRTRPRGAAPSRPAARSRRVRTTTSRLRVVRRAVALAARCVLGVHARVARARSRVAASEALAVRPPRSASRAPPALAQARADGRVVLVDVVGRAASSSGAGTRCAARTRRPRRRTRRRNGSGAACGRRRASSPTARAFDGCWCRRQIDSVNRRCQPLSSESMCAVVALELALGEVACSTHERKPHGVSARARTGQGRGLPRTAARARLRSGSREQVHVAVLSTSAIVEARRRAARARATRGENRCRWSARNERYDAPNTSISAASMLGTSSASAPPGRARRDGRAQLGIDVAHVLEHELVQHRVERRPPRCRTPASPAPRPSVAVEGGEAVAATRPRRRRAD